jgi:hypothetical protein
MREGRSAGIFLFGDRRSGFRKIVVFGFNVLVLDLGRFHDFTGDISSFLLLFLLLFGLRVIVVTKVVRHAANLLRAVVLDAVAFGIPADEPNEAGNDAVVLQNPQTQVVVGKLQKGVDDPVVERLLSIVVQQGDE